MDELATAPALDEYPQGFTRCAVHQQTQRTFAVAMTDGVESNAVTILDSHLQVVATVEAAESTSYEDEPIYDVAVHGDQVLVLTTSDHPQGPGLRLLDLDGRYLRTIAAGQLRKPEAVAASHGRAFVVDKDYAEEEDPIGHVLLVIDIDSGDILQRVPCRVPVDLVEEVAAVLVDGEEIYIAGYSNSMVDVLPFVGSEA